MIIRAVSCQQFFQQHTPLTHHTAGMPLHHPSQRVTRLRMLLSGKTGPSHCMHFNHLWKWLPLDPPQKHIMNSPPINELKWLPLKLQCSFFADPNNPTRNPASVSTTILKRLLQCYMYFKAIKKPLLNPSPLWPAALALSTTFPWTDLGGGMMWGKSIDTGALTLPSRSFHLIPVSFVNVECNPPCRAIAKISDKLCKRAWHTA